MKTLRNIIAGTLAAATLWSCSDFLEVDNFTGIPSDGFVNNAANAQTVLNGAYNGLYGLETWRAEIYYYLDFATGELEYRATDGNLIPLTNFGYTPDQAWIKGYWRCLYRLIGRSNDACNKMWNLKRDAANYGNMSASDKDDLEKMIGECNFLRALGYYYLVRSFGEALPSDPAYAPEKMGIPVADSLLTDKSQLMIGRSTLKESWDKVIKDFTEAYNRLPERWPNSKLGAATKGAAAAYLGQAYMYFGMRDPQALETAKTWFDRAMQAGNYRLAPDFNDNFDYMHENNSESIFEVQAETANDDEIGNYMWRRLGPEPIWWGACQVSKKYVNKFIGGYCVDQAIYDRLTDASNRIMVQEEPSIALAAYTRLVYGSKIDVSASDEEEFFGMYTGDYDQLAADINAAVKAEKPRTRFNIMTDDPAFGTISSKYFQTVKKESAKETDPRMYDSFYIPNVDVLYHRWDMTDEPTIYTTQYYGFKKYIPNNAIESWAGEGLPGFEGNNPINQRIYRLAELYLMYAEIMYRQGNTTEAARYLNMVRRRAWGEDVESSAPQPHDYDQATDGQFLDALVLEREKEMCLEGTLWFDYLRMGLATTLFADRGYDHEIHSRLPIPLAERQLIGMNILLQNPGY